MRDFFPRSPAEGDDEPVDLAQVRADDALIEALRGTPLFDEPTMPSAGWLRAVPDRLGDEADGEPIDDGHAAAMRFADTDAVTDAPVPGDGDARIAALLQAWRSELDATPLPAPLDLQVATAILRSAPRRRRSVRPMIAVAAAIAGLLLGSTAIGARSATPDNTLLWPVTQLLWGDKAEQVLASIEVRQGIDGAAKALDAGHPDQAEAALDHVTVVITKVEDSSERQTLQSDLGRVQSQLESSRASTTPPTGAGTPTTAPSTAGTTSVVPSTSAPSTESASVDPPTTSAGPSIEPDVPTTPGETTTAPPPPETTPEVPVTTGGEVPVETTTPVVVTTTPEVGSPSTTEAPVSTPDAVPPAEADAPGQVPAG